MGIKSLVALGVLGVILAVALQLGLAVLFVFMFIWNISDIQNVGPNFWNIFWLALATLGSLGVLRAVFSN